MQRKHKIQYTIRQISIPLDRSLRELARKGRKSLNQVVVEALTKQAGVDGAAIVYSDLDYLIGSWVEDVGVEKALKEQRKIDKAFWK